MFIIKILWTLPVRSLDRRAGTAFFALLVFLSMRRLVACSCMITDHRALRMMEMQLSPAVDLNDAEIDVMPGDQQPEGGGAVVAHWKMGCQEQTSQAREEHNDRSRRFYPPLYPHP